MQIVKMDSMPDPALYPSMHQLELEHGLYSRRLDTLREKPYLTDTEKLEEVRLKKLKLFLKDEMERMRRMGFGPTPSL